MLIMLISKSWDYWVVSTYIFVWISFFFFFYNVFGLDLTEAHLYNKHD